jgi:LPXTG-motif cell wall-anchored protein
VNFDNCTQAYAAGRSHIPQGDPAYRPGLDRDKDGFACDNPPDGFVAAPRETQTFTATGTATAPPGDQLPKTGPATELGITGGTLLALGTLLAVLRRRRRLRFTA